LINGIYPEFSYPKAVSTQARSIRENQVAGQYVDASGATHGFIVTDPELPLRHVWQTIDDPKADDLHRREQHQSASRHRRHLQKRPWYVPWLHRDRPKSLTKDV
jgi:hypothetical protein